MAARMTLALLSAIATFPLVLADSPVPLTAVPDDPLAAVLSSTTDRPTDHYIVGFYQMPADRSSYAGYPVVAADDALRFLVVKTGNPADLKVKAIADPNARYVAWDNPAYARLEFVPNDTRYNDAGHWGSKKIGAEAAWDRTRGSTSIKVAMIDSGLNKAHEDITGSRVLQGHDFHNNDTDPNDESGCSFHGTHTTGTAGATINNGRGIAGMSQHTILPVKALGSSFFGCTGSQSGLASALRYARDQGAHVSSNSWGGGGVDATLNSAIQYAHDGGVIHVAAAGNSGPCTNCVSEPWKSKASIVIIVASTTETDGQSSFSSEGAEVDVSAPGSNILSSTSGTTGYGSLSGTSMATPHVAGTAGLIKALQPTYTFAQMESRLRTTGVDLGPAGCDTDFGCGRINADAATNGLGGGGNTPPTASFTFTTSALTVSVNGSGSSDPDGSIASYSWNWGDGTANGSGVTASHTYAAAGTYTVTLTVTDNLGATGSTTRSVTVSSGGGGETQVYFENLDDAAAQGWTKSTASDIWHVEDGCVTDYSPAYKLAWTRTGGACNYNTGARVTGWAQSAAISLAGKTQATLKLVHQFNIEQFSGGAYDILRVQVSGDALTWTTLQQWDSRNADVTAWTALTYDIDSRAGGNLYVRFWTDTIDGLNNANAGWFIDNIEVTAA